MQAVILAGICEFLGAVLLGANVADTIKSGIAKLPAFAGTPGMLCCKLWCFLAYFPHLTLLKPQCFLVYPQLTRCLLQT